MWKCEGANQPPVVLRGGLPRAEDLPTIKSDPIHLRGIAPVFTIPFVRIGVIENRLVWAVVLELEWMDRFSVLGD